MKSAVSSIRVGTRHRKEMGDLQALADSILAEGLLQPIGVTESMELVFGERRLRAVRDILKRDTIDVRIVKVSSIVAGEMAENDIRKDFTVSERVAIGKAVEEDVARRTALRHNVVINMARHGGVATPEMLDRVANLPPLKPGQKGRDLAAERAGFSSTGTYRSAKAVSDSGVPKLVAKMDSGEVSISAAATIAKAAPSVQEVVVALPSAEQREAVTKLKEDAERARHVAEEQEKRTGPTAFTGFLKKNGRYPDAEEAKTLAKLDYRETPDASGKKHLPVTKEQAKQIKEDRKLAHQRYTEIWRLHQATQLLCYNKMDPADTFSELYESGEEIIQRTLEQAFDWISRFREEWHSRGKKVA